MEDHLDSAELIAELLRDQGHEVFLAHDATAALRIADEQRPCLVLLDIGLPGVDGYEVARRLRAAGVPRRIIALTGYARERDRQLALEAGIDDHLVKPIDITRLLALVSA